MPPSIKDLKKQGVAFATFPEVRIYNKPGGKSIQHLIFGDVITPPKLKNGTGYKTWSGSLTRKVGKVTWIQVRSRLTEGWVKLSQLQLNRTLEVNFVDIGQGDGCHLVTPDDKHYVIDAGQSDNMYRFLRWRFNLGKKGASLPQFTAIISHPDQDHWKGFEWLLWKIPADQKRILQFDKIYHNGILQREGSKIGRIKKHNGQHYLIDYIIEHNQMLKTLNKTGKKSNLEKMFIGIMKRNPDLKFETLYKGFSSSNIIHKNGVELKVVAPVPEKIDGKLLCRWFDEKTTDIGKTKNGHSIVLIASIGRMKVLLGGDLNSTSADYLMQHYSGVDVRRLRMQIEAENSEARKQKLQLQLERVIEKCREVFGAEIAKSCHHGSHDITDELLQSINPIATVISSGDQESHFHPRPETLGIIGKSGRGKRPLIFSTEIGRSAPEFIDLTKKQNTSDKKKQRIISTYGMVTVRSDGNNAVICQKLEKSRSSYGELTKWHLDKIIWNDERGEFISMKEYREPIKKNYN